MKDPQLELEHLCKLDIILEDGTMLALLRRYFTGEPDTGTTRPSGSEGAGRKRTPVMVQRAALRPYTRNHAPRCIRLKRDVMCRPS